MASRVVWLVICLVFASSKFFMSFHIVALGVNFETVQLCAATLEALLVLKTVNALGIRGIEIKDVRHRGCLKRSKFAVVSAWPKRP